MQWLLEVNGGGGYTSALNVSVQSLGLWTQQCCLLYTTLELLCQIYTILQCSSSC